MKAIIIGLLALAVCGVGTFAYLRLSQTEAPEPQAPVITSAKPARETIGTSVEGRTIEAYRFPARTPVGRHVLIVGGIHGGYEWNSVILAYELIDYLLADPTRIPETLAVTVIPSANPDGVFAVVKKEGRFAVADVPAAGTEIGRFNANEVDLNRNFDCKWKPTSQWRGDIVSAGTSAFSEPESRALRDFALDHMPDAAVFLHSQAGAVYASECGRGILPETLALMSAYAKAAGYPMVQTFDAYPVTGDAEGWLASIGIPAISVELTTHESIEWEKNLAGVKALFARYGSAPRE
jgi:predicted deacylase